MQNITRKAGSTDVSVVIRIVDSTDGSPETGVTAATAGLALEYRREGATSTAITEADLTNLNDAHSDGGLKHIGNGYYRLDLPDAAVAASSAGCLVHGTVTSMVVIGCYIDLTQTPADVTHWLGTAAATPTTAGVPEVDLTHIAGAAVSTSTAQLGVNVVSSGAAAGVTALKKNTAKSNIMMYLELTAGGPATGKTVTVEISKDGGAFAAIAGAITEVSDGFYKFNLTATELNADVVALTGNATACNQASATIFTQV